MSAGAQVAVARRPVPALRVPWRAIAVRTGRGAASVATLILLWQGLVAAFDPNPILFPAPAAVWEQFLEVWRKGLLWPAVADSASAMGLGLALAIVVGIASGIPVGVVPLVEAAVTPYLWALFAMPKVALTPLVILWLGIGLEAKLALVFLSAVIPVILSCQEGVRTVDESLIRAARAFGANTRQLVVHVIAPSTLPFIASGVRNGISRGFVGLLVIEMSVGTGGIGSQVMRAMRSFNSARMFAYVIVLIIGALLVIGLSRWVETYLSRWREEAEV